jgi:uncharacterized protein (DUF4415 family)
MTIPEAKARLQTHKHRNLKPEDDSEINFSDAPELSDTQLGTMKRSGPGRPPLGNEPRKMISIKLDTKLLSELKAEAKKDGKPYQSLIHEILERYVRKIAA